MIENQDNVKGRVIVYGTPAEEFGGGKAEMIKHNVFDECDFCIMAHPSQYDLPDPIMVAVSQFKVVFKGIQYITKVNDVQCWAPCFS